MMFLIMFTLMLGWAGLCLAEPGHGWQCGRPVVEVVFDLGCSLGCRVGVPAGIKLGRSLGVKVSSQSLIDRDGWRYAQPWVRAVAS